MKLLVVIPAYNEAQAIGRVLKSVKKEVNTLSGVKKTQVLVIDDGSTDSTSQIANKNADIVLRHVLNQGVGCALTTAFRYAQKYNYDMVLTFDADGQHKAHDISRLIKAMLISKADVVNGSRLLGKGNMPLVRKLVNYCANLLIWLLTGLWSTDSQSGMRVFNYNAVNKLSFKTRGMEVASEILYQTKLNNLIYVESPIDAIYTDYSKRKGQKLTNAPKLLFRFLISLIH